MTNDECRRSGRCRRSCRVRCRRSTSSRPPEMTTRRPSRRSPAPVPAARYRLDAHVPARRRDRAHRRRARAARGRRGGGRDAVPVGRDDDQHDDDHERPRAPRARRVRTSPPMPVPMPMPIPPATASPMERAPAVVGADDRTVAELRRQIEDNGWRVAALGEAYNGVMVRYEDARVRAVWSRRRAEATRRRLDADARPSCALSPPVGTGESRRRHRDCRCRRCRSTSAATRGTPRSPTAARTTDSATFGDCSVGWPPTSKLATKAVRDAEATRVLLVAAVQRVDAANTLEMTLLTLVEGRRAGAADEPGRPCAGGGGSAAGAGVAAGRGGDPLRACAAREAVRLRDLGAGDVRLLGADDDGVASGGRAGWRTSRARSTRRSRRWRCPQLQPGDLVFKGPGGSRHVALYLGGGLQIAATHTGDYVRVQPLMPGISGAVRPG